MPLRTPWKPLLEGDLALRSTLLLDEILDILARPENAHRNLTICGGLSGRALLYHYVGLARNDDEWQNRAVDLLDQAAEILQDLDEQDPSLFSGYPGLAFAFQHIHGTVDEDALAEIDERLMTYFRLNHWPGVYDLISGLVGNGIYALERLPSRSGQAILHRLLDHLDLLKQERPEGYAWFTPPDHLPEWQRKKAPDGYLNLGLSHGNAGVVGLLGRIHKAGIQPERTKNLLEGSLRWLLAQQNPPNFYSRYRTWVPPTAHEPKYAESRVAWCYGDLGVAIGLLMGVQGAGLKEFQEEALRVARSAAQFPLEHAGDVDAGICHGAAGNAHLFNRIYQATGEKVFREAAVTWYERIFMHRQDHRGVAGFGAYRGRKTPAEEPRFDADTGFLEGLDGIALVLLAGLGGPVPEWDRLLMANLEPMDSARNHSI